VGRPAVDGVVGFDGCLVADPGRDESFFRLGKLLGTRVALVESGALLAAFTLVEGVVEAVPPVCLMAEVEVDAAVFPALEAAGELKPFGFVATPTGLTGATGNDWTLG